MKSLRDAPLGMLRLWKLLRSRPVDLIHAHLYNANLLGRLIGTAKRIPVVSSLHSVDYEPSFFQTDPFVSQWKLHILRVLDRVSCRFANPEFVSVSEYVKASAVKHLGISPNRVRVIYNSVDPQSFQALGDESDSMQKALELPPGSPVVLCVARFHPEKGLQYLIEAVPLIADRFPDVCVLFVGGGPDELARSYRMRANRLGISHMVRFLGVQADVRPYLALCDVFVLPSLCEGLGLAVVEAMAMGRACVATRVSALPEVIADGRSGILVNPADPPALAEAVSTLIGDPALRQKMGQEGRRLVFERFNVAHRIVDLEELYRQVVAQNVLSS